MITDYLEKTTIFMDLDSSELEDLALFCSRHEYCDGEILIEENRQDNFDIFILIEGSIEIVSRDSDLVSDEVVLSKHDKDLFGEIGWLTNRKRSATVRCAGTVEVIRIDGVALRNYVEINASVGYNVMRRIAIMLSHNLAETSNLLKQILWNNNI